MVSADQLLKRIQSFNEAADSRYIYQNELHEVCFQHDMADWDFKHLPGKTASDKVLCDTIMNWP